MTEIDDWVAVDGQPPADLIRERSRVHLERRVDGLLAPWRQEYAGTPETTPPPPEVSLALNRFWWRCVIVKPQFLDVVPLTGDSDPLNRLASPYLCAADRIRWLRDRIDAFRSAAVINVAAHIVDALASGKLRLTGVRTPLINDSIARIDVPTAILSRRRWQLMADNVLTMDEAPGAFVDLVLSAAPADHGAALEWVAERLKRENGVAPTRDELETALAQRGFPKRETRQLFANLSPDLKRAPGESARRIARARKPTTDR